MPHDRSFSAVAPHRGARSPRGLAAIGVAAALAVAALVAPAASAAVGTVTVKGHVTSPTGRPVAGVVATVVTYTSSGYTLKEVRTSRTGRYEIRALRASKGYELIVHDPGDDDLDFGDGAWAPVSERFEVPGASTVLNAVLHHGAQVSGRVYDSAGSPVRAGLVVRATGSAVVVEATTITDRTGAYRFRNLPAGATTIAADSPTTNGGPRFYSASTASGVLSAADATAVSLRFGRKNPGRSIRFPVVGKITGRFTIDGATRPGTTANAVRTVLYDGNGRKVAEQSGGPTFKFRDLAAGTYVVAFERTASGAAISPEYFADAADLAGAKRLVVPAGGALSGLTADLSTAPTATSTATPTPVPTPTASATPTAVPTASATPTAAPTATPAPTATTR